MKKRYQFISYVLIMTMVLSFVPITKEDFVAFAEEIITTDDEELLDSGSCGENLTYKLTTDGTLTISGTGEMTIAPWSKYCNKIKKINMEEGITKIHVNAFADCQLVESIKIPDTVTEIENGVFFRCYKLKEVEMSKNIMSIGEDSFYRTAFYDDLNNWEGCALYCGDALIAIIDPSDLYEYTWCDIREGTRIVADSATYASRPGGVGERSYCTALYGLKCPDSLIRIGNEAFYNCTNLTYVYFSKNLKEIGSRAFKKCLNVTDVEYPIEKLEVLGERACEDLKNVETVTFPARVNKIDWNSFWNIFYFNSSLYTLYIYNPYMNLDEFQRKTITLIYGYRNSTAYECARKNEINFIAIDRDEPSSETSQQTTEPNTTPKEDPETPIETTTSEVSETPKESTTPENVETPKETTTLENVETSKDTTTPDNLETPSENSANDTTVPIEETTPKELDTAIEIITAEPGVTKYSTTADSNQTTMQGINDKSTKPAIKKIKEKNWHTVKITWKKISGIKKYILYRSKKKSGKYKKIATTSKRSVLDKKVKAGAKYYYKIKVTNSRKESFISKTKAIRVKGTPNKPKIKLSVNSSFWQIHWGIISDNSVGIEIYMKNGEGKFKKFTRINRTVNIKKSKKKKGVTGIQSSVDSLKKGLAYQFKARTYTKVKGKKVYSKWSKTIHYTRK